MAKGILLGEDNDLKIENRSIVVGDSMTQDAFIVLSINQGELKDDPLAGVNLTRMIRGHVKREKMRKTIELGLARVGVWVEDIQEQLRIMANNEVVR